MREKQLLRSLVLDAIQSYKLTRSSLYVDREKQIDRLQSLCSSLQDQRLLEMSVRQILKEIRASQRSWLGDRHSHFGDLLEAALDRYESMLEAHAIQSVLLDMANQDIVPNPLPGYVEIMEEARGLQNP